MEIMVVSDASTDDSEAIATEFASRGVQLMRVPRGGKAAALNAAIPRLKGEILVLTDVRQALAPDSLRLLIACFADPTVGAVSAELHILQGERHEESDFGLYWRYEIWMRKHMSRIGSTFGTNGPYYAMRRELAEPIPPDTLIDDVVMLLPCLFRGYRIILEPGAKAFDFPTTLKSEFRRKLRTLGGLWQVFLRHPKLLSSANPMRFHFVSQKVGRLFLPYALLLLTLSAFGLPPPWRLGRWGLGAVLRSGTAGSTNAREIHSQATHLAHPYVLGDVRGLPLRGLGFLRVPAETVEGYAGQPSRPRFRTAVLIRNLL